MNQYPEDIKLANRPALVQSLHYVGRHNNIILESLLERKLHQFSKKIFYSHI